MKRYLFLSLSSPTVAVCVRAPVILTYDGPFDLPVPDAPSTPVMRRSSCLSPGPAYDDPDTPDPELVGPLSTQPDWPINSAWAEFAFAPVVLSTRSFSLSFHVMTISLTFDSPTGTHL